MTNPPQDVPGHRFCPDCACWHGSLYICDFYGDELAAAIAEEATRWRNNLANPQWVKEQLDKGVPTMAIVAMQAFAATGEDKP